MTKYKACEKSMHSLDSTYCAAKAQVAHDYFRYILSDLEYSHLPTKKLRVYAQAYHANKKTAAVSPLFFEILVRLEESHNNIKTPDLFFGSIDANNLGNQLDIWVIIKAFHTVAPHFYKQPSKLGLCSINVRPNTLEGSGVVYLFRRLLTKFPWLKNKICIEITEQTPFIDKSIALFNIQKIRKLGIQIALDDFGTGYSTFSYVSEFPLDIIKIDGRFIKNVHLNKVDEYIVESIIKVSHSLGLKVVAEYVHNLDVFELVESMGVDFVQGSYIAKPIALTTLLSKT
jgi:EAL domain-containing protein (putative c-di-GMP-specific phosphodiesterase class I)